MGGFALHRRYDLCLHLRMSACFCVCFVYVLAPFPYFVFLLWLETYIYLCTCLRVHKSIVWMRDPAGPIQQFSGILRN